MSFILNASPKGFVYGYQANDNVTFIQRIATPELAKSMKHDYLYENGRRDKVQAYFAIGIFEAIHEMESKLYAQSCLSLSKIREIIGKTNATVVVIADGRISTINKNATMVQIIPESGVTLTFGDVETGSIEFANAEFTKLGYIQQVNTFVTEAPAE